MPTTHLLVLDEDPVNLDGGLDSTTALQFAHGSDSLSSYSQCLHAAHDDLNEPTGIVTVKLTDFSAGGDNWQVTASHSRGAATWSRGTGFASFDFGALESEVEVDVVATSDASPAQTKARKLWIKTKPTDGLPDRPQA